MRKKTLYLGVFVFDNDPLHVYFCALATVEM